MPGFADIFAEYAGTPLPSAKQDAVVTTTPTKKQAVEAASQRKRQIMGSNPVRDAAVGSVGNTGAASGSELENDVRYLSPPELIRKYGYEQAGMLQGGYLDEVRQLRNKASTPRTGEAAVGDVLNSSVMGFVNSIGGLAALGTGAVNAEGGRNVNAALKGLNNWTDGFKSDATRERGEVNAEFSRLDERDNKKRYNDIKDSDPLAGLKRIGNDAVDGFVRAFEDPVTVSETAADATGSLLSGSVVAGTLRAIGRGILGKGAATAVGAKAAKIGNAASLPAAIGLQEGGGAYQATMNEMLARGYSTEDANDAALQAAAIQIPIGATTGVLVSKFERNPFKVNSAGQFFGNVGREAVEEGIQGGTGQAAQNYAVSQFDDSQDLLDGVGTQVGRGAAAGILASSAIQGPSAAVRTPLEIVGAGARAVANLRQAKVSDAIAGLAAAKDRVAEFARTADPENQTTIGGYADRVSTFVGGFNVDTIKELAKVARDKTAPLADQISAAIRLKKQVDEAGALSSEPEAGDVNAATSVWDHVDTIVNSAPVQQALAKVKNLVEEVRAGNLKLNDPKATAEAIKTILFHEEQGDLFLSPEERQDINLTQNLIETQQEYEVQTKEIKAPITPDVVSDSIQLDSGDKKQPSAAEYMRIVVSAMRAGNTEEAVTQLNKFMNFAKVLNNKVGALNTDLENPEITGPNTGTPYLNYTSRGVWRMSNLKMYTNRSLPGTFKFARQVAADAQAVTTLANNLAVTFPELGIEPLTPTELNPEIKGEVPVKQAVEQAPNVAPETAAPSSTEGGDKSTEADALVKFADQVKSLDREQLQENMDAIRDQAPEKRSKQDRDQYRILRDELSSRKPSAKTEASPAASEASSKEEVTVERPEQLKSPSKSKEKAAEPVVNEEPQPKVVQAPEEVPVETAGIETTDTPDAASDVRGSEPDASPERVVDVKPETGLVSVFPNLIGSSQLAKAFKLAKRTKTRVFGKGNSVQLIVDALKSQEAFEAFIGKTNRHRLTPAVAGAYYALFGRGANMAASLDANLQKYLTKNAAQIKSGEAMTWVEGKIYNLVQENEDGSMGYNPELLGSALLAGLQWALTSNRYQPELDAEAVSKILKINQSQVTEPMIAFMRQGAGLTEVKRQIADTITRYWGMETNPNEPISLAKGIAEAMASEIIEAMLDNGLMNSGVQSEKKGKPTGINAHLRMEIDGKTVDRYQVTPLEGNLEELRSFPTAIEEAIMLDPEIDISVGQKLTKIAETQLNSPQVPNTENQKEAIRAEQDTAHNLVQLTSDSILGMGKPLVLRLFGEGDLTKRVLNLQHKKTLEGRNQTLAGAFDALEALKDRIVNATTGNDPFQTDVHFAANLSSIGRMQVRGGFNPQSSKLIRETLVPGKSVLNLSKKNTKDFSRYGLALAQALGGPLQLKIENVSRKVAVNTIIDALETGIYAPAIKILSDHITSQKALSSKDIEAIREIFGEPLEVVAFHALLDYANFKLSKNKAEYETGLYVETDGVTNGPSNAVLLMTLGAFTADNLVNMAKGGVFLLKKGLTMNQHRQTNEGSIDFYMKASNKLRRKLVDLRSTFATPAMLQQMDSLNWMLDQFLPGVTIKDGQIDVNRKVTKNPMTITLYGAGAKGIAGNLVYEMTTEIYARLSEALEIHEKDKTISLAEAMFGKQTSVNRSALEMLDEFTKHMDNLALNITYMDTAPGRNPMLKTFRLTGEKATPPVERMTDPKFKFKKKQLDNMATTMRWLFVEPMRSAITETVGTSLMSSLDLVQVATQTIGVIGKYVFRREINKLLETKDFPSQKDLDKAWEEASKYGLKIESGDQTFMPSGSEKFDIGSREFGRALNGRLRTDSYAYSPENPGVSGIPTMNVGMGDGSMIQRFLTTVGNVLRSTRVFDGINMPLDQLEEGSLQANKAAWEAMIGNNPIAAILTSFEKMLGNDWLNIVSNDSDAAAEISRSLGVAESDANEIKNAIELIHERLIEASKDIEARHAVLSRIKGATIDQMAGVGVPYVQEDGDIDLEGLSEETATHVLNEALDEERAKLDPKESPDEIGEEIKLIGSNDLKTGVTTVSFNQLKSLLGKLTIPDEQKTLLREIVRSLATKKYRIAAGTLSQLAQWAEKNAGQAVPTVKPGRSIKGFMSVADKIIYLVNSSSETLTHELLHAATFEKLVAHYAGTEKLPPQEVAAIQRIEALMSQFLQLDDVSFTQRQAYDNAKREIEVHLKSTDAVSKAAAVNEFMAWALSNRDLIELQKQSVVSKLAAIGKALLEEIKTVVFGKRASPKVNTDMYSNLRFNTSILLGEAPSVEELVGGRLLFQATAASESDIRNIDYLNKIRDTFQAKINQFLNWKLVDLNAKSQAFLRATQLAEDVGQTFEQHFNMTPDQVSTFKIVVAALSTQAKLDPNSLAEIQDLFRITTDQLTPETFKNDPTSTDPQEDFVARGRFDAIVGNFTRQKDSEGRSTLLSAFLALSMVNPEFRQVLTKIKIEKPELERWNSTDGIINNAGFALMDKLSALVSGADRNAPDVAAAISALTHSMVEAAQDRVSIVDRVLGPVGSLINGGNDVIVEGMQLLGKQFSKGADVIDNKTDSRLARASANILRVTAALIDETQADDIHTGLISRMNRTMMPDFFKEVINEMIGRTLDNAGVYDLIKITRSKVQQVRQQFREQLPVTIASKFSRELTEYEWTVLFKGLAKTDLAALKSNLPVSRIMLMLQDPNRMIGEIASLENSVQSLDSVNYPKILKKAKELAEWMNTGVAQSENPLRNATAVANLYGEVRPGSSKASPQLVRAVDQLVTLYALRGLPEGISQQLQQLARDEAEGTSFALSYLIGQRADEQSKVDQSGLARANHYKGFIPSESTKAGSLVVAEDGSEHAQKLIGMGYKQVAKYVGSKAEPDLARSYYWSPISAKAAFRQGEIQNVRPTASGVDPLTGFTNIATTAGQIVDAQNVSTIRRNLKLNTATKERLLPIYNETGHIIAFERAIDPDQEIKLARETNLSRAMGAWAGRNAEELHAVSANQAIIVQTKKMYDRDAGTRKDEYINLFGKLDDAVLRDAVGLINKNTRNFIESTYGQKNEFWVRKDMLLDVIGARRASVGDLWTGNTRWSPTTQKLFRDMATKIFGDDAYTYLVKAESFWQNIITDARVTIVVKSVIVPMANLASNYIQLMSRGLNPIHIARAMPKKAAEVNSYIKNRVRKIELEAELRAVENDPTKSRRLRAEIQSLSDAERRLTIWPLIQAGEFSSISDVAISRDEVSLAEGRLQEYIEKLTDKLPDSMKTLGRYAIVAKDTALFKGLQRTVEYGDFLGKAVLYDHLIQNKKMSSEAAIANVSDEFVNYDRLSGRQRDYLESIGLMWFWNFKIRSTKIAMNMLRNNPLNASLALMIPGLVGMDLPGSPMADNGFMVMADGRLSYTLGFDQLLAAHSLNPWIQVAN